MRRVIVGFSGGVTSAWCAGWALRNFPREEVVLLWHDTKEEHKDTYRFLHEMAAALDMPIVERSDGRSDGRSSSTTRGTSGTARTPFAPGS